MEAALPKKLPVNINLGLELLGSFQKIEYWTPEPELARLPRLVRMAAELTMLMQAKAHVGWKQHGVIVLLLLFEVAQMQVGFKNFIFMNVLVDIIRCGFPCDQRFLTWRLETKASWCHWVPIVTIGPGDEMKGLGGRW